MDEWLWITRAAAVIGFVLGIGNTAKLVLDARRSHRETKRNAAAKEKLASLVRWFTEEPSRRSAEFQADYADDEFLSAVELGVKQGVLKLSWDRGRMGVRLARFDDGLK